MSWSACFRKPVPKMDALKAIDDLGFDSTQSDSLGNLVAIDQLSAAKDCARLLLKSVPGPLVMVRIHGHANGVGWDRKPGVASETIQVSVTQATEEDLKYYH